MLILKWLRVSGCQAEGEGWVSLDISNAPKKNTVALLDYRRRMIKHLVTVG